MADDFQRLLAGDRRAHRLLDVLASRTFRVSTATFVVREGGIHALRSTARLLTSRDRAENGVISKPRNVGKRQLAAVDVHAAEFGAAVQGRKHFSGIEQALRVERAFQPLLLVEIDLA